MMRQQRNGGAATGRPAIDDSIPDWLVQLHDKVYQSNIDLVVPIPRRTSIGIGYRPFLRQWYPYDQRHPLPPSEQLHLEAASQARTNLRLADFPILVERLRILAPQIRPSLDRRLARFNDHDLACMLAIDALSLLGLFIIGGHERNVSSGNSRTVVKDLLAPNFQLPFIVLDEILNNAHRSLLLRRIHSFCVEISPFQIPLVYPAEEIQQPLDLLDFFYRLVLLGGPALEDGDEDDVSLRSDNSLFSGTVLGILHWLADVVFEFFNIPKRLRQERRYGRVIPSASLLKEDGGIRFRAVGNFDSMGFDSERRVLCLPRFTWREQHTMEVASMLLAYEGRPEPSSSTFILLGYFELMRALLVWREDKDFQVLEDAQVIRARDHVYTLFAQVQGDVPGENEERMKGKELQHDKVAETVEAVNSYYEGLFTVRWRMMRRDMARTISEIGYALGGIILLCALFLVVLSLILSIVRGDWDDAYVVVRT